jgi:hypothetical protein
MEQNEKLLKKVSSLEDRLEIIESKFSCSDAPTCINKKVIKE